MMDQESFLVFERLLGMLAPYYQNRKKDPFVVYHEPAELAALLQLDQNRGEGDWDGLFFWVEQYLRYAVKTGHPGYINRMWSGANLPSIVGEIVTALTNTSACTYETAPVSTLMEKYMLKTMLELVGFNNGIGEMTTGSSNANMIAMLVARNKRDLSIKQSGLSDKPEFFAFVNAEAHYSMDRAANILGIGTHHLIKIPVDSHGRMDTAILAQRLQETEQNGGVPFFVSATAGTTVRGGYDAIEPLLPLRERHGFWLHVDGAWGGAVIFSETLRERFLPHLKQADSFSLDFHKMPGTALMCNALLFNNSPTILRDTCSAGDESYIFREGEDGDIRDLGTQSLQCGRRVDSLKWFLDWKFYGKEGFCQRIEQYYHLCEYAEQQILQSNELELLVPRESFNLCFRYRLPKNSMVKSVDDFTRRIRERLHERHQFLVGTAFVNGQLILRLLITNLNVGKKEIDDFLLAVVRTGRELLEENTGCS